MLSYPIPEACDLLDSKLKGAKGKIADCEEDLDFLREQITVSHCFAFHRSGTKKRVDWRMECIARWPMVWGVALTLYKTLPAWRL